MTIRIDDYTADDARLVEAFFQRVHDGDETVPTSSLESWQAMTANAIFGGGADFRLAREDGAIVGVLTSGILAAPDGAVRHMRIVVDPRARRRGIATQLLDAARCQLIDGAPPVLQCLCPAEWRAGAQFLRARGFTPVHEELDMELSAPFPAADPSPAGASIEAATGEVPWAALAELHNQAYAGSFGFAPIDTDDFRGLFGWGEPLLLLAREGDRVVGFCHSLVEDDEVTYCIESVVVSSTWRRRGVGRALITAALQDGERRQLSRARLNVDAVNRGARALYEQIGFRQSGATTGFRTKTQ